MPTPALLLLIAALLPLVGFGVLLFMGRKFGNPLSGYVGAAMAAGSWALSLAVMVSWVKTGTYNGNDYGSGVGPVDWSVRWLTVGGVHLDLGIYIDSLTVAMVNMITMVGVLVHVYALGFMRKERNYPRFFCYMGLGSFAVMGVVVAGTLFQMLVFWQLLSVAVFLMMGFYAIDGVARGALVINLLGDVGFLVAMIGVLVGQGNSSLPQAWVNLGGFGAWIGVGLVVAAIAKGAQFPLQAWFADITAAPTPGQVLIGVIGAGGAAGYLLGRIFPILTPEVKAGIAIAGCVTLTLAALIAMAQRDLPRLIAWCCVCQMGYVFLGIGVNGWVGGMFYLITNSFCMALLVLAGGAVCRACGGERDLMQMGGLVRKLPVTAGTFGVGVLCVAGVPFLSAAASRGMILVDAGAYSDGEASWPHRLIFILPMVSVGVITFALARAWILAFVGRSRNRPVYNEAKELPVMWAPLLFLAGLAVMSGTTLMDVRGMLVWTVKETNQNSWRLLGDAEMKFNAYSAAWPTPELDADEAGVEAGMPAMSNARVWVRKFTPMAWVIGMTMAVLVYWRGLKVAGWLEGFGPIRFAGSVLRGEFYFSPLYRLVVGRPVELVASLTQFSESGLDLLARVILRMGRRR